MAFLDALGDAVSQNGRSSHRRHKKRRSRSRSRSPSPSRSSTRSRSRRQGSRSFAGSIFGDGDSNYQKHNASRGSFFGLGNFGRSSLFGNSSRPSYYKRSPRQGFLQRCLKQLKRLLRDLQHYAKRHPWKVFFLVIMPLVTGGALTALLARFGLRIPPSIERMLGMASRAATGDPFSAVGDAVRMAGEYGAAPYGASRSRNGGLQWERRSSYYDSRAGGDGWVENIRRGVSEIFS